MSDDTTQIAGITQNSSSTSMGHTVQMPPGNILGWDTITSVPSYQHVKNSIQLDEDKDVIIGDISLKDAIKSIDAIKQRLFIIEEDFEKHEQYPALKHAYEQYKLVEKLIMGDKK